MATTMITPPFEQPPTGDIRTPYEVQVQDPLPTYSPRTAHVSQHAEEREFEYKIEKKKGETLASLKVLAPAAYSKNIPTFCGTGPVKGSVNLYLDEPDTITSVVVSVRGRFYPGHSDRMEHFTLFDLSDTLWSEDGDATAANPLLSNKKLSGTHSWPFSFSIPERIQFQAGTSTSTTHDSAPGTTQYHIPQTFIERILTTTIRYEIMLHIGRGKFKSDYNINCTFGYFPITRPPPFPALKSIAYQERTPLLDPTVDTDGWIAAKAAKISGTLFDSHPIVVDCQLFISAPLVYTRGSVIPLYVSLKSTNQEALDLLVTHKALRARLERRIEYCLPTMSIKHAENYHTGKDRRDFAEATWWSAPSVDSEGSAPTVLAVHTVGLNGEIHLGDLAPSTTFPAFSISYNVCLDALNSPGFKMANVDDALLVHPVEIVTSFAPGPRAVRYAAPGYNADKPVPMEFGLALSMGNPLPDSSWE